MTSVENILGTLVALSIIESIGNGERLKEGGDRVEYVNQHSHKVLTELGLRKNLAPSLAAVARQIDARGGWEKPRKTRLDYLAQCLECDHAQIMVFGSGAERRKYVSDHQGKFDHISISRWEAPFNPDAIEE